MNSSRVVLFSLLVLAFAWGCESGPTSPNQGPAVPQSVVGLLIPEPNLLLVFWGNRYGYAVDGYNVYLQVDNQDPQRLNTSPVTEELLGDPDEELRSLFYDIDLHDVPTGDTNIFWVTSVKGGDESPPSDPVVYMPREVDYFDRVTGLFPSNREGLALQPVFRWNARPGAKGYVLLVEVQEDPYRLTWLCSCTDTQVSYKGNACVTFASDTKNALPPASRIGWGVIAISQHNLALALTTAYFRTTSTDRDDSQVGDSSISDPGFGRLRATPVAVQRTTTRDVSLRPLEARNMAALRASGMFGRNH